MVNSFDNLVYNLLQKISLQCDSTEYSAIERLFKTTMHGFTIQRIERIQNRGLWEVFQWCVYKSSDLLLLYKLKILQVIVSSFSSLFLSSQAERSDEKE